MPERFVPAMIRILDGDKAGYIRPAIKDLKHMRVLPVGMLVEAREVWDCTVRDQHLAATRDEPRRWHGGEWGWEWTPLSRVELLDVRPMSKHALLAGEL